MIDGRRGLDTRNERGLNVMVFIEDAWLSFISSFQKQIKIESRHLTRNSWRWPLPTWHLTSDADLGCKIVLQTFTADSLLCCVVLAYWESTNNDKLLIKFQERIVITMMQSYFLDIIFLSTRADL